jgi:putative effector of murein hydrolase
VHLSGKSFDITGLGHEEQVVADEGFTQWSWDVVPLEAGVKVLSLIITFRIYAYVREEVIDYPVLERAIIVRVSPVYSTTRFVRRHWQWVIGTVVGSGSLATVIAWAIKKWVFS